MKCANLFFQKEYLIEADGESDELLKKIGKIINTRNHHYRYVGSIKGNTFRFTHHVYGQLYNTWCFGSISSISRNNRKTSILLKFGYDLDALLPFIIVTTFILLVIFFTDMLYLMPLLLIPYFIFKSKLKEDSKTILNDLEEIFEAKGVEMKEKTNS